jgi:pyrroline-5-carboxylate reductase
MIIGIIGLGRLGSALARGLDRANKDIVILGYNRNLNKAKELSLKVKSIKLCDSDNDIFDHCGIIFLWTNGPDTAKVLGKNAAVIRKRRHIIITCTPGIPLDSYTDRWAETLPNVNMPVGKGVTMINFSRMMKGSDRAAVIELLSQVGNVYETSPEDMPYYSAISSCGPALYATIMELFTDTLSKHHGYDRNRPYRKMVWLSTL